MSNRLEFIRTKAKLLQKSKRKTDSKFQLKEAYEILARAAGFASWREWKEILDEHLLFSPKGAAYWHVWYSNYQEALLHLDKTPQNFLIPSQKHFFVCDEHYIQSLGVSLNDPDLIAVGNNWVEPANQMAWCKLIKKLI